MSKVFNVQCYCCLCAVLAERDQLYNSNVDFFNLRQRLLNLLVITIVKFILLSIGADITSMQSTFKLKSTRSTK